MALILRFAADASIVIACGSWSGPQEPMFPTGDDIAVLWQPGTLPVLAPFLQDGPNRPLLLPGADASAALRAGVPHRSVSYAGRRQTLPVLPRPTA